MATSYVIGLDIGTTSTVGILVGLPGTVAAVASRQTTLSSPQPGWAEEDPAEWWNNTCAVLQELMAALPAPKSALAGIAVTGMLPAVVLLDEAGQVLRPSIQQSDGRCSAEVDELRNEVPEARFLARTGNGVNQQLVAAKLRWIERHEPAAFARIATVFGSYDYINWRLTGVHAIEQNWALEAGFTDLAGHAIADDLVALAHIPRAALPRRTVAHERLGAVTGAAAGATGLPEGLPVFGGAADHIASALAAGVTRAGDVLLKFGGAGDIVTATDKVRPDARLYLDYHLVPGLYAPNGCMAASGSALNWLAGLLRPSRGGAHRRLDKLAESVPAGSDGVLCLPYFLGEKTPIHDPLARGTFTGLSLGHGPEHLWRALLEAVAYGFRHHVEVLTELGYAPARFLASDGGTASRVWMQVTADVVGAPVRLLRQSHGSCVGAAWVAAMGSGQNVGWGDVTRLARFGRTVRPNPANAAVYARGYRDFRALYEALRALFRARAQP